MSFDSFVNNEKSMGTRFAFGFLLLFLAFLPLYEAPKNIFSVFFLLLGSWIAIKHHNAMQIFKKKDPAAWGFLLLGISPFFAGIDSAYTVFGDRFSDALNWSHMVLVALSLMLFSISRNQVVWLLRVLCLSSVLAVIQAFYQWDGFYPELNSVGHVNQSSLYLAVCLVPAVLLFFQTQMPVDRVLILATGLAVFCYLAPSRSIMGFGIACIVLIVFITVFMVQRRWVKRGGVAICLAATLIAVVVYVPSEYLGPYQSLKVKLENRLASDENTYSRRDQLVSSALMLAGKSAFGSGLGSFREVVSLKNLKQSVAERGDDWQAVRGQYFVSNHGHNMFANVLVERGWFGVVSISLFLLVILGIFLKRIQQTESQIGASTVLVICLSGLGQSALHVEHGQLSLICLALCLKLSGTGKGLS